MRKISVYLTVLVLMGAAANLLGAAEWGDLSGQIIFDGPVPVPEKATITSDKEVCCQHDVLKEVKNSRRNKNCSPYATAITATPLVRCRCVIQ